MSVGLLDTSYTQRTRYPFRLATGQTTVTTAGTRVALAASTIVISVVITANQGNTGNIFVGNSNVTSANGYILTPGASVTFDFENLADIFIDAATSGDVVSFLGVRE